jgi:hypothetical protein
MRAVAIAFLAACGSTAPPAPAPGHEVPPSVSPPPSPIAQVGVVTVIGSGPDLRLESGVVFEDPQPRAGDEVDVVDCGGWQASIQLVAETADPVGWTATILETTPSPAWGPCRDGARWNAFAIVPSDPAHQRARPVDQTAWTGAGIPSMWADLDGDGTIDLVEHEERCKPGDDYVCGTISVLDAGAWREVGRTTPL